VFWIKLYRNRFGFQFLARFQPIRHDSPPLFPAQMAARISLKNLACLLLRPIDHFPAQLPQRGMQQRRTVHYFLCSCEALITFFALGNPGEKVHSEHLRS
jgi:hypothetical protein